MVWLAVLQMVLLARWAEASFNLYLSTQEMKRLLGLENELYYVTDGTVNKYAMGFVIPVPSSVRALHFTWSASTPTPPSLAPDPPTLRYTLATASSHPAALATPSLNISRTGTVPSEPQVWRLSLECTGKEAAEVVVTLDLQLTGLDSALPANLTDLRFRRKKTCFLTPEPEGGAPGAGPGAELQAGGVPAYVVFFAGVGSCLLLLVLLLSLVIATWLRSTAAAKPPAGATPEPPACTTALCTTAELTQNNHSELHNPSSGCQGSPRAASLPAEEVQGLVVARSALTLGDLLLEGTFGRVYQGRLVTASPAGPVDVMVKTVVTGSSRAQAEKLVTEGSLLYPAAGRGVLAILATTSDGTSPIMIYEYLYPGNLKRWLATCHQPVSTHQAVSLGLQLLSALQHVHRAGLLHRDVAARNCYISSASTSTSLAVKLCDSALSRDLFPGDYHCLGDNDNRPVKWMALDSLQSGHFTASSDVWAWGVVMWEILTRAQQPFPDIDPGEMESYLAEGFRLHQPVNCPDQLYTVMVSCWSHRPHHRAGLPALYTHLKQFNTQLQQFV